MSYLSPDWLVWVWATVGLHWLAPRPWRPFVLIALSLAFMVSVSPVSAALLLAFLGITHTSANILPPTRRNTALGAAAIIATLIAFKLGQTVESDLLLNTVLVPLGLSYYSFRCLHVLIERHKGRIPRTSLKDLAHYLVFMPTFLIGPIHRFEAFQADSRRQRFDPGQLSLGLERIIQGYALIVILGNVLTLQMLGRVIAAQPNPQGALALYLGIAQNGLNLYFQFAGHSAIAIGFSLMLGFRIMENFHWPYLQPNISAFWQSWHRSLSLWTRDYVYGVVVARTRSPALGALATMVIIGLWHEISLRFLLWGAWHGLGLIAWQQFQRIKTTQGWTLPKPLHTPVHILSVLVTVHFVWFGFVLLTAPTAADALAQLTRFVRAF